MQQSVMFPVAPEVFLLAKIEEPTILNEEELESLISQLKLAYEDPDYSVVTNYNFSVEVINDNVR